MAEAFYDKVTKKFGTSEGVPRPFVNYFQGNPEEIFEQKLLELSGKDKVALDLGCGDGRFTLLINPCANFVELPGEIRKANGIKTP